MAEVHTLTNGPQPSVYQAFVDRIERVQADIDEVDTRAKEEKAPHKQDIAEIYNEAKDAGADVKALKHVVRKRRAALKAQRAFEKLDTAERSNVISIEAALGPFIDTPLGQAAAAAQ